MKKANLAKKGKLGLEKKTIVKLLSGALTSGTDTNTLSTTQGGEIDALLIAYLTQ